MRSRTDLHVYQNRAVDYINAKKCCGLFLGLGLGKSAITLTAMSDLIDGMIVNNVLVIAPLRVSNSVWKQEARQWDHLHRLKINVCTGSVKERRAGLSAPADIYVINRENVPWLVEHYGYENWPFDAVVIDESTSFKSWQAKRWKALKKILPKTRYRVLLTGTPSPNSLMDLWAQLYLIDGGERLGKTITGFKKKYFESDYMGYNWTLKSDADKAIHRKISDVTLSMSSEDYQELPTRIDITESVTLPDGAQKYYDELEKELLATLPDGEEIEAVNAAVLANKLIQTSNGNVYINEARDYSVLHKTKMDALKDIVVDNHEPMLVAYNYKSDLSELRKAFPKAYVLDKETKTIDQWNKGEIDMLLAHPASAAYGLNLQFGGSLCVWYGLNWSLELYQQFNARLHRQGQTKPVRVIHIIAEGTIDERVMNVLKSKDKTQKALIAALK